MEVGHVVSSAIISECGKYRFKLVRRWDLNKPTCAFIMLNPSTADENRDDPTIRRCVGFAKSWGFGGVTIYNLFSFRATSPKILKEVPFPVGPGAVDYLHSALQHPCVIAAWGVHGKAVDRRWVERWEHRAKQSRNCYHLGLTKNGDPKHPLYLKKDTIRIKWA